MEVPAGQVNFRGSFPRSENNILQPMLHLDYIYEIYLVVI